MCFCRLIYGLDLSPGKTRVALLTYSSNTRVHFYLDQYAGASRERLMNVITYPYRAPGSRGSNTQDALYQMRNQIFSSSKGDRYGMPNVGVIVTDGKSNMYQHNTIPEAQRVQDYAGARLYVVSTSPERNMAELEGMASDAQNGVLQVSSPDRVDAMADQLARTLCY